MVQFNPVTGPLLEKLGQVVGGENVLTGHDEREPYAGDEMCIPKPHLPEVVVKPGDAQAVARVLALANEAGIPVTPRGGGTGLSGGAVPPL